MAENVNPKEVKTNTNIFRNNISALPSILYFQFVATQCVCNVLFSVYLFYGVTGYTLNMNCRKPIGRKYQPPKRKKKSIFFRNNFCN